MKAVINLRDSQQEQQCTSINCVCNSFFFFLILLLPLLPKRLSKDIANATSSYSISMSRGERERKEAAIIIHSASKASWCVLAVSPLHSSSSSSPTEFLFFSYFVFVLVLFCYSLAPIGCWAHPDMYTAAAVPLLLRLLV